MKQLTLFFGGFLLMTLTSCIKEGDLINQDCNDSCTTVNGLLLTGNGNQPLSDAYLEVIWENSDQSSSTNRVKASGNTDENGYYELKFHLEEDELKAGFHRVQINVSDDNYLKHCVRDYYDFKLLHLTNDTTVTIDFGIPLKTTLDIKAIGASEMGDNDRFYVGLRSPFGVGFNSGCEDGFLIQSTNQSAEQIYTKEVAAHQPVVVHIDITKNGQRVNKYDTLSMNVGEKTEYIVEFQ